MKVRTGNLYNSSFGCGKEAVMAKYLFGLLMVAIVAVILGISTSASAGPCKDQCNVKYLPGPKLTACIDQCKPQDRYCRCLKKKVPIAQWSRNKCVTACSDPVDMVACASINDGAGGEIKSGQECKPCSELDPSAVESEDGSQCVKHCPLFDKAKPLSGFEENCPSCESKGHVLSDDGKNCVNKKVVRGPVPVAAPVDVCKDCGKGCDFFCLTLWDIILFILLIAALIYWYMKRKELLDSFDKFKKDVKATLKQAASQTDLGTMKHLLNLEAVYWQKKSKRDEAAEVKAGIEDRVGSLLGEEQGLDGMLKKAQQQLAEAETGGPEVLSDDEEDAIFDSHEGTRDARRAVQERKQELESEFQVKLDSLRAEVTEAEDALGAHTPLKESVDEELEEAKKHFTNAADELKVIEDGIDKIRKTHPALFAPPPVPRGGKNGGTSS